MWTKKSRANNAASLRFSISDDFTPCRYLRYDGKEIVWEETVGRKIVVVLEEKKYIFFLLKNCVDWWNIVEEDTGSSAIFNATTANNAIYSFKKALEKKTANILDKSLKRFKRDNKRLYKQKGL
jgi:hypothetical protein